ncbi:hypothetical protein [Moorena sp. SIO3H5]|uniref:hypothetical protein n=1 Tax=Moorena sp. SIO3H5 TaxID=2607834 RepID=UPI0013BE7FBB|nr:hypothetical protein [Moorena sp. SIO3H5]NEO72831.1 hypothetical protein [Moorena sp. SIO3H5]
MGSEPDRFTNKRDREAVPKEHRITSHCPPTGLITVDVGWAVNQTDSPTSAIAKRFRRNIALLDTAHQSG